MRLFRPIYLLAVILLLATFYDSYGGIGQLSGGGGTISGGGTAPSGAAGGDLSGTYPNPTIAIGAVGSNNIANDSILDVDVNSAAGITLSKLAALGANFALQSDASGFISASSVTSTELGYVSGVTSAIQTQLNGKEPTIAAGLASQYYRGDKSFQTLDTLAVAENTNLYFTDARSIASPLTGFVSGAGTVLATDSILQAIQKLDGNVAGKEDAISAGTTAQYWRGDKSFQTLDTLAVAENTNLYFTNARAIAAPITGFVSGAGALAGTDSLLQAIQKLDGNIGTKEDAISAGTAAQYWRGDKTFQTLDTLAVAENTNLYFTDARARTAAVADSITDAVTNIAPSQNAVFDALALKADASSLANYLPLAGGTMSGALLNQASIQLEDPGVGAFKTTIQAATLAADYTLTLPVDDGTAGQILQTDGSGVLSWISGAAPTGAAGGDLTGTYPNPSIAANAVTSAKINDGEIVDADINASAAIALSKLAALTINRALVSDGSGVISPSAVTSTELGYVSGVTSAIQTQLNGKEPTIAAGTAAQYYRGDKTFQTLDTLAVAENTNLYFTNARAIAAPLTGYVSGAGTVVATDTILQAIQKLNGNDANYLPLAGGTVTGATTFQQNVTLNKLLKLTPITTAQRDIDYPTPAAGDVIFNDTLKQGQYYNGTAWISF